MLIVYTQPTCTYSKELIKWLKKEGIQYEERDITKDHQWWDELHAHNVRATPLIVNGKKTALGFNPDLIKKLIEE